MQFLQKLKIFQEKRFLDVKDTYILASFVTHRNFKFFVRNNLVEISLEKYEKEFTNNYYFNFD